MFSSKSLWHVPLERKAEEEGVYPEVFGETLNGSLERTNRPHFIACSHSGAGHVVKWVGKTWMST